jgi:pyruvate/2-oxoglutarate dehydrogenase complex dihydrolipoamide dehydrogenase (E3) component
VNDVHHFDAIIIGTGQAGPALAKRLADAQLSVAIIERHLFGGTCVNTGCIPTKAMVASAYAAHVVKRAGEYGIRIGAEPSIDFPALMARTSAISERSRKGVETMLRKLPKCVVYQGHARFTSAHDVVVNDDVLRADRIFINVGGRAVVALPGIESVAYLTNSSMMALDVVPRHLVIVGGGYVGLEFGQMFRRFGSKVTIIEMAARLVHREDEDVSASIQAILANEHIDIRLNARCIGVAPHADGAAVTLDCSDGAPTVHGSHLLVAVGRRPNPTIWAWTLPPSTATIAATSSSTTASKRALPASGPSATATARGHSRIRRTTISRSWRRTSSTASRVVCRIAFRHTRCTSIRRWGAPACPKRKRYATVIRFSSALAP